MMVDLTPQELSTCAAAVRQKRKKVERELGKTTLPHLININRSKLERYIALETKLTNLVGEPMEVE